MPLSSSESFGVTHILSCAACLQIGVNILKVLLESLICNGVWSLFFEEYLGRTRLNVLVLIVWVLYSLQQLAQNPCMYVQFRLLTVVASVASVASGGLAAQLLPVWVLYEWVLQRIWYELYVFSCISIYCLHPRFSYNTLSMLKLSLYSSIVFHICCDLGTLGISYINVSLLLLTHSDC